VTVAETESTIHCIVQFIDQFLLVLREMQAIGGILRGIQPQLL